MEDFKEKLYHFQAEPPEDTWIEIASSLPRQRPSRVLFYAVTAAASLLAIMMFTATLRVADSHLAPPVAATRFVGRPPQVIADSVQENNRQLQDIIRGSKLNQGMALYTGDSHPGPPKKYLTVAGPGGQPVKISPKVATLIESADNKYPPRPVWNKKIDKWKQIMLSSLVSPTATNLMDIVQASSINTPHQ